MPLPLLLAQLAATTDGAFAELFRHLEPLMEQMEKMSPDADPMTFMQTFAGVLGVEDPAARFIRLLTVFLLAMWVGFEVITKVPQRLHTPLTSGSNAISGITAVGAIVVAGAVASGFGFGNLLGLVAVVFAMINVAGGFVVTHRMLEMFQPKKK